MIQTAGGSDLAGALLAGVALFDQLSEEELADLAACLKRQRWAAGDVIFRRGDPGSALCIVARGRVQIALTTPGGEEMTLAHLGPGEVFGELALLDGDPRSADARAVEPTELQLLDRDDFLPFVAARPTVAMRLLSLLSRRLREDAELVQDAAFLDLPARLARAILTLAEKHGVRTPHGIPMTEALTHAELAKAIGAAHNSVERWLGTYEREGLIRMDGYRILILKPDQLRDRVARSKWSQRSRRPTVKIRVACFRHLEQDIAVFDADAPSHTDQDRNRLLADLSKKAREAGLRVQQASLAFKEDDQIAYYGPPALVAYLSTEGVPSWTHTLAV